MIVPVEISDKDRNKLIFKNIFTVKKLLLFSALLILLLLIGFNADLKEPRYWFASTQETNTGRIVQIEPTNTTVNDRRYVRYYFLFEAADGNSYYGDSYGPWMMDVGDKARVEYIPSSINEYARIDGTRHDTISFWFFAIALIAFLVGLYFTFVPKAKSLKEELDWLAEECNMTYAHQAEVEEYTENGYGTGLLRVTYEYEVEGETYLYQDELGADDLSGYPPEELIVFEREDPEEAELVVEYPKPIQVYLRSLMG